MTILAAAGERWDPPEPQRVQEYEVDVSSPSRPGVTYRVARSHDGVLIHRRVCPAWEFGRKSECRHHRYARWLTERPLDRLACELPALVTALNKAAAKADDDRDLLPHVRAISARLLAGLTASEDRERWLAAERRAAATSPEARVARVVEAHRIMPSGGGR